MLDRLGQLLGQGTSRQEYQDYVQRYDTDPSQISDAEAARRYREMMQHSRDDDDDDFDDDNTFGRMSPQEREDLARRYQDASRDSNRPYQGYPQDMPIEDAARPGNLGRMTRQAAREDGDLLDQLVGKDSPLSSTLGKLALAGGAAYLAKKYLSKR